LLGFNKGGPVSPLGPGIKITMVRAEHSSEIRHVDPATKKITMYPGGEPCGYIIELENGFKIYHAGDTGIFADMKFIGEYYRPDLALLPIGGHFTMDPADAAYAVRNLLKTKTVIPMHYGTTKLLKGTPTAFKEALAGSSTRVIVMRPGETRTF
jgi:L-ascorbate metabolism protein UlaG (beta-lactamase superfamily)